MPIPTSKSELYRLMASPLFSRPRKSMMYVLSAGKISPCPIPPTNPVTMRSGSPRTWAMTNRLAAMMSAAGRMTVFPPVPVRKVAQPEPGQDRRQREDEEERPDPGDPDRVAEDGDEVDHGPADGPVEDGHARDDHGQDPRHGPQDLQAPAARRRRRLLLRPADLARRQNEGQRGQQEQDARVVERARAEPPQELLGQQRPDRVGDEPRDPDDAHGLGQPVDRGQVGAHGDRGRHADAPAQPGQGPQQQGQPARVADEVEEGRRQDEEEDAPERRSAARRAGRSSGRTGAGWRWPRRCRRP